MKKYILFFIIFVFLGSSAFGDYFIKKTDMWKVYSRLYSYYFFKSSLFDSYIQVKTIANVRSIEKDDADVKEYVKIFMQFREAPGNNQKQWRDFCLKIVGDYKNFLKKYPKSLLADDVKLRIAEYYHAAGMKYKSKYWLEDIIKNHKFDGYCKVGLETKTLSRRMRFTYYFENREYIKTAAWALFYRGYWFGERKYLELVLKNYPNCLDPANEARDVLREWNRKKENRIKLKKGS